MFRDLFGKTYVHLILIAAVGLLVYSNTLDVPFQWDEEFTIENNPIIKDPGYFLEPSRAKAFGNLYLDFKSRYIGYLTFAINYSLHGLDVRGYHVLNIALHLLNAFLVYFLVRLTLRAVQNITPPSPPLNLRGGGEGLIPLFAALLFVSHPIQTEAVNYTMGRLPLLMSFFYLSSIVLYAKWRITPLSSPLTLRGDRGGLLYLLSLLCAVFAMKTKENAFTLPFAVLLYEVFFFGRHVEIATRHDAPRNDVIASEGSQAQAKQSRLSLKRRLFYLLPFALTLLIIPLTRMGAPAVVGEEYSAMRHFTSISPLSYLFTQFRVIVTYIRLLFLPVNQNFGYDYPVFDSFLVPQVYLSFLLLLSILALAVYLFYRSRDVPGLKVVSFGIVWFFLTLSIESSIFPIAMIICEYRVYLPSVGAMIALSMGTVILLHRVRSKGIQNISIVLAIMIVSIFSFSSYARNNVWRSEISLWEDVVKKSPRHANGYFNLGMVYSERGMINDAIINYQKALKFDPEHSRAYNNLGKSYQLKGLFDKAAECYASSLKFDAGNIIAHFNLGEAYRMKGFNDKAIEHFQKAIILNPEFAEAHLNLGLAYLGNKNTGEALREFETALQIDPNLHKARWLLYQYR